MQSLLLSGLLASVFSGVAAGIPVVSYGRIQNILKPAPAFALPQGSSSLDLCLIQELQKTPLCDLSLTYIERASQFVSLLTLREKVQQMGNKAPAIDRLGLPKYQWWNEALHGVL